MLQRVHASEVVENIFPEERDDAIRDVALEAHTQETEDPLQILTPLLSLSPIRNPPQDLDDLDETVLYEEGNGISSYWQRHLFSLDLEDNPVVEAAMAFDLVVALPKADPNYIHPKVRRPGPSIMMLEKMAAECYRTSHATTISRPKSRRVKKKVPPTKPSMTLIHQRSFKGKKSHSRNPSETPLCAAQLRPANYRASSDLHH